MKQFILIFLTLFCLEASAQQRDTAWLRYYTDNRAIVMRDSLYGYVDRQGREVIPCQYKKAYNFNDGIAMVRHDYEVYAIDTTGRRLDRKVQIPQFKDHDFERFVYWVWQRIPFASTEEAERMKDQTVYALVTIGRNGTITACEEVQSSSPEAFSKVHDVVMNAPKWTPGTVDGEAVELRYLLPVEFRKLHPVRCFAVDDEGKRIPHDFTFALFDGEYAYSFLNWFFSRRNMWFKNRDDYYQAQSGLVRALFTVDKKGKVRDIEIVASHNDVCRDKTIALLQKSPRWTPGTMDGKPVAVRYDMSFYFNFR